MQIGIKCSKCGSIIEVEIKEYEDAIKKKVKEEDAAVYKTLTEKDAD